MGNVWAEEVTDEPKTLGGDEANAAIAAAKLSPSWEVTVSKDWTAATAKGELARLVAQVKRMRRILAACEEYEAVQAEFQKPEEKS